MSDVVWWVWLLTGLVVGTNFGALMMGVLCGIRHGPGVHRQGAPPLGWWEQ